MKVWTLAVMAAKTKGQVTAMILSLLQKHSGHAHRRGAEVDRAIAATLRAARPTWLSSFIFSDHRLSSMPAFNETLAFRILILVCLCKACEILKAARPRRRHGDILFLLIRMRSN